MDRDLIRRAEAAGIQTSYRDWRDETVQVSEETLGAILAALGPDPARDAAQTTESGSATESVPAAESAPAVEAVGGDTGPPEAKPIAAEAAVAATAGHPARPRFPSRRTWGFAVQLYSVRSRGSWGHGDLRDLAGLAQWSASELGAGFILVNPLHAAEPVPPISPSPYLPMTRRFLSPLYLRVEDVPEYQALTAEQREQIARLAAPLRERNQAPDLIDRDAVWTAKRTALELIHEVRPSSSRRAEFDRFRAAGGSELAAWSAWCALAERHGPDWRTWPAPLRDPAHGMRLAAAGRPGVDGELAAGGDLGADGELAADAPGAGEGEELAAGAAVADGDLAAGAGGELGADRDLRAAAQFHAWLQWLADEQLSAAQRAARAAGMDIGIITDLAVGAHPGGADAWAHQDLLVPGISVGAPPDGFNQLGQDWGQPPWHPGRLAATGYRPLAELFAAAFRHAGGLRVDHVMGLMRLWWIPAGLTPDRGAYVRYDHAAAVAALSRSAARAGAVAIGEDLGTVDPWISTYLAGHGVLGTTMLWFATAPDGSPLPPGQWRRACLATVGTHDVPPAAGFLSGAQVTVRARLGLLKDTQQAERAHAKYLLRAWLDTLRADGLLESRGQPSPDEFTIACYGYLARTPAMLIGVSLADAVGESRSQNVPGTTDEYPNWRVPLADGSGRPVLVEELPSLPLVRAVARAAAPG